jgi:hypothetical protein
LLICSTSTALLSILLMPTCCTQNFFIFAYVLELNKACAGGKPRQIPAKS